MMGGECYGDGRRVLSSWEEGTRQWEEGAKVMGRSVAAKVVRTHEEELHVNCTHKYI